MIIRVRHLGWVACTISVAFANDQYLEKFDKEQSARILAIQSALAAGDSSKARTLATDQLKDINTRIEGHGTFGPHQRSATVQLGASLLTQQVVNDLESNTMYSGNTISFVSNYYLNKTYGVELKFVEAKGTEPSKWVAVMPTDTKKIKTYLAAQMSGDVKKVWDSLSEVQKDDVARASVNQLATDLKSIIPKDDTISEKMKEGLVAKSAEIDKRLVDLRKDLSSSNMLDESEKRLLAAERKVAEGLRDSKDGVSLAKFCEDMAASLDNPEDIKRRADLMSDINPCREPVSSKLKPEEGRNLADEPSSTPTYESSGAAKVDADGEHPEGDPAKEEPEGDSDEETEDEKAAKRKEEKRRELAAKTEADKKLTDQNKVNEALVAELQAAKQATLAAQGQANQIQQMLSMQNACQQPVNLPMSSEGASQNQEQISELSDALGKKIADASVAMCESGTSPSKIVSSMVPYGPLTEADQAKARDASENFFEVAGKLAKSRPEYDQLMAMLRDEASAAALERLRVENSSWINPTVLPHLKTLNKDELLTIDPSVQMSTLAKGATHINFIAPLTNKYLENYNSALTKLKIKNKVNFDYDIRQQCSIDLARVSGNRWGQEASRSISAMGPSQAASLARMQGVLGALDVKNAPSSENKPKKVYRQ